MDHVSLLLYFHTAELRHSRYIQLLLRKTGITSTALVRLPLLTLAVRYLAAFLFGCKSFVPLPYQHFSLHHTDYILSKNSVLYLDEAVSFLVKTSSSLSYVYKEIGVMLSPSSSAITKNVFPCSFCFINSSFVIMPFTSL